MLIALATDRNYIELAGVLITSIVLNGDVSDASFVVCSDGLTADDKRVLQSCARSQNINFFDMTVGLRKRLRHVHVTNNWPLAVWSRVVLPEITDDSEGRMLYLDCDIVVSKSLRPLFDIDMRGKAMAAVPVDKSADFVAGINRRIKRPAATPYFNSGAILIDIVKWKLEKITQKALDAAQEFGENLTYPDQDALNIADQGAFLELDRKWNWYSIKDDPSAASIIHFVYEKPHISGSKHPARDTYMAVRANTPWRDRPLVSPWVKKRKKLLQRIQSVFGL